jgi:Nif11 domain
MSKETLDLFFESLMTDMELQRTLMKIENFEEFTEIAQKIGRERGYNFTMEEMENYIKEEMFQGSMTEKDLDSEMVLTSTKPWLQFITNLKWSKGKNRQLWQRFINNN